jgi:1,4-dihydroxy-2-naphthoyl-CoA synthase
LQANTTNQIKQQFKITIIYIQKVEQVKEINQAGLLRLQSLLVPLEKKAQSLAGDLKENNAADRFLKKAFNLIEETKQDIKDLEYAPGGISNIKYFDLTVGKKIQTIKDLLMKVERLIYISS